MKDHTSFTRCQEHDLPAMPKWHNVLGDIWKCKKGCMHIFGKSKHAKWITSIVTNRDGFYENTKYSSDFILGMKVAADIAQERGYQINGSGPSIGESIALYIIEKAEEMKAWTTRKHFKRVGDRRNPYCHFTLMQFHGGEYGESWFECSHCGHIIGVSPKTGEYV